MGMTSKHRGSERCILEYPRHKLKPEDLLNFIELSCFTTDWEALGLDDDDLLDLQVAIMANPKGGALVPGTGGLRKMRFAPRRWRVGRSGAARVCYVYFEDYSIILLALVYAKGHKVELSAADKKAIKQVARM